VRLPLVSNSRPEAIETLGAPAPIL